MILTPNLQTTLFSKLNFEDKSCLYIHCLFKSVGGTTKYENPGENTDVHVYMCVCTEILATE